MDKSPKNNIKISGKRLVRRFFNLVKIDSPSGEEREMVAELQQLMKEELKLSVDKDKTGNLYSFIPGKGEPALFCVHTDTVEPGRNIEPQIKNGIISSKSETILGMDNKAALAVALEAVKILKKKNIDHKPIELLFTVGEEIGCVGAKAFDCSKIKSRRGFTIDNYDAPIGTITTKSFHYQTVDIKIIGKAMHAGDYLTEPEPRGVCALEVAAKAISQINIGKLSPRTSLSFGKVKGGHARNSVIDKMNLQAEIRTFRKNGFKKVNKMIRRGFQKAARAKGAKVEIVNKYLVPGYKISEKSRFLKQVKKTFACLGITPQEVSGGTDANILNQKGIETLDLSIGGKNAHQTSEQISVKELETMLCFILTFLQV